MKIIQTFWTGNGSKDNPLNRHGGWLSPEYNWMSWALSCLQLQKIYGEVELFTDTLGKKILIDILRLPYSKVSITLDHTLDGFPDEVWALSKIHTYASQQEPFVHFDGDLFLWEPIPEDLLSSDILVQNKEMDLAFYRLTLDAINSCFHHIPPFCSAAFYNDKPILSINGGIIGGNDLDFFKRYRQAAFDFVSANSGQLHEIRTDNLNFIFEQYFLYCLAEQAQTPIRCVSDNVVDDLLYGDYVNFSRIPQIKFIHPVGGHKRNVHVCDNVSRTLRLEYPAMYEFILSVTQRSGIPLFNKAFMDNSELTHEQHLLQQMNFYRRTNALVKHLAVIKEKPLPSPNMDFDEQEDFDRISRSLMPTKEELLLLSEVRQLENAKKQAYFNIYGNRDELYNLFRDDAERYARVKRLLRLQPDEISGIEIVQNRPIATISVTNNWICPDADNVEELIKYKYDNLQPIDDHILFVPKIIRMQVDEYMLDGLDGMLFNYCTDARPVKDILEYMAAYFEKEEIEKNYDSFVDLIVGSLSRLCYLDVLRVKN